MTRPAPVPGSRVGAGCQHDTEAVAHDRSATSLFFAEVLGLEPLFEFGPFAVFKVSKDATLDFVNADGEIASLYYAFWVRDEEFDEIFARVRERNLIYWSDPYRLGPGNIDHWDDGRGVDFPTPTITSLRSSLAPTAAAAPRPVIPTPLVAASVPPAGDN
jgi:hypothetical protein